LVPRGTTFNGENQQTMSPAGRRTAQPQRAQQAAIRWGPPRPPHSERPAPWPGDARQAPHPVTASRTRLWPTCRLAAPDLSYLPLPVPVPADGSRLASPVPNAQRM